VSVCAAMCSFLLASYPMPTPFLLGLNRCRHQVHFFESPSPGVVYGKLNWRVVEPDGEFLERHAVQRFVQDPKAPGHLQNYDNEYLVCKKEQKTR